MDVRWAGLAILFLVPVWASAQERVAPQPLPGNPLPAYPEAARAQQAEGLAAFRIRVAADGSTEAVEVVSVPAEGVGFEDAAREALRRWRFEPAREDGRAVPGVYESRLPFFLNLSFARSRMFAASAQVAWTAALRALREARLPTAILDRKNQVAVTRALAVASRQDLPALPVPPRYQPQDFYFQVFVSPFVEPARVHVSAVLDTHDRLERKYGRRYNSVAVLEGWLMERIATALGDEGHAIPQFERRRRALARRLLGGSPSPCHEVTEATALTGQSEPLAIIWRERVGYPAVAGYSGGEVVVRVEIMEDGAVSDARLVRENAPSAEYVVSVLEEERASRWRPHRIGGCPTQSWVERTVQFGG